jgi:hypothetical protein
MNDQNSGQDKLGNVEVMVEEKKRKPSENLTGDDVMDANGLIVREVSAAKVLGVEPEEFDRAWKK